MKWAGLITSLTRHCTAAIAGSDSSFLTYIRMVNCVLFVKEQKDVSKLRDFTVYVLLFSGARNSRFDPSAYIKEKERKRKEAVLKK